MGHYSVTGSSILGSYTRVFMVASTSSRLHVTETGISSVVCGTSLRNAFHRCKIDVRPLLTRSLFGAGIHNLSLSPPQPTKKKQSDEGV